MTKIKAVICRDEWFPVYQLEFNKNSWLFKTNKNIVEISQADKEKYKRICQEFEELQTKLGKLAGDKW
jgi:hypothetical protein